MAYTSEIEKLERRWLENPKGRNFAPLADAYRKAGELDRAIDLCRSGLEQHPDYVSAHIVYGRCLIDMKDDPGAEEVFRKVLQLDQENILALKVLGEIADRNGRFDQEVEWLTRLLAADPMNGDAAEMLTRAKTKAATAKTVEPLAMQMPEPIGDSGAALELEPPSLGIESAALAEAPTTAMEQPDFVVEHASSEDAAPPAVTPVSAAEIETYDGTVDFNAVAHEAAKADGIEVQEEVELKPDVAPLDGLARTQYEGSGMFKLESPSEGEPPPSPPPSPFSQAIDSGEDLPSVDLPLIMPDDVTPTPPPRTSGGGSRRVSAPAPMPPPAAVTLSDDDGAADTAALSQAEPVVTETMADLYLRQGHREDALRVYEALLAQRPRDARLQAKVNELSGRAPARRAARSGTQSVGAFLKRVLAGKAGAPPPVVFASEPRPEATPASGESSASLEEAFASVLGDEPLPGAPTRPAEDSISLDSVFGDAVGGASAGRDSTPQVEPAPGARAAGGGGGETPAGGGFSFDEFFSPPAAASESLPGQKGTPPPRGSGRQARAGEDEGDLDQFQSWLKGLKS